MKDRVLGRTGLRVNRLGFGGIPIQRVSEEEAVRVVRRCYELGINYFDTARLYTVSEERIGKALEDVRDEVVIATKSGCRDRSGVLQELETSLRCLRTSYVDVYQLHAVSSPEAWKQIQGENGAIAALHEARDRGMIRYLGVTSHDIELLPEIVRSGVFDTVLVQYNYLTTQATQVLLPLCRERSVGTVVMKPLGGGAFSNARVSLKFVLANGDVDVAIPGMMSVAEVEENVSVAEGDYGLTEEEKNSIQSDAASLGSQYCRACDYCQPCPQKIPISFILRAELQLLKLTGWTDRIERQYQQAKARVDTCLRCGQCESKCPYRLPIRELLPTRMASLTKRHETVSTHAS